jgi:hypothetical protein
MYINMPALRYAVCVSALLVNHAVQAQGMPCEVASPLASTLHNRVLRLSDQGNVLAAQEARRSFWLIHGHSSTCAQVIQLAFNLGQRRHGQNEGTTSQTEFLRRAFQHAGVNPLPGDVCLDLQGPGCVLVVRGGSGEANGDGPPPRVVWISKPAPK